MKGKVLTGMSVEELNAYKTELAAEMAALNDEMQRAEDALQPLLDDQRIATILPNVDPAVLAAIPEDLRQAIIQGTAAGAGAEALPGNEG